MKKYLYLSLCGCVAVGALLTGVSMSKPALTAIVPAPLELRLPKCWRTPPAWASPKAEPMLQPAASAVSPKWTSLPNIPLGRSEAQIASVGGKIFVFGGYTSLTIITPTFDVHVYNPSTSKWTHLNDMPVGLTHSGVAVDGQFIYFAGGYPPTPERTYQIYGTTMAWRYNTVNDTWTSLPPLPSARGAGAMACVSNVLHYFSGADSTRTDSHSHWALNLANLKSGWTTAAPIPTARNHLGTAVLGTIIYAIGGAHNQDAAETALPTVEFYNPATNKWTTGPSLPTPRALIQSSVTTLNGKIIVAGGETAYNDPTAQVTSFNPATGTWTQLNPLPSPRMAGLCAVQGNNLIFTTGAYWYAPGVFSTTAWLGTFGS